MKTAVITGGGGGLGRAMAAQLHEIGWHTALLDLPSALADVPENEYQSLHPCDVTDAESVARVVSELRALRPSLDMAVYNAGITVIAPFERLDPTAHRKAFEVNYWGAVNLAAAIWPDLRKARGTHLAVTSVAGFAPLKQRTAYAGSKHAMTGFFMSLRGEEAPFDVHVAIAAPSFVATNPGAQFDAAGVGRPGAAADGIDAMSPNEAARIILKGALRRQAFIPVGRVARLAWWLSRLAPSLYERQMLKSIARETS